MAWCEGDLSDGLLAAGEAWVMDLRAAADTDEVHRLAQQLGAQLAGQVKGASVAALLVATCHVLQQFARPDVALIGYIQALDGCSNLVVAGSPAGAGEGLH